MSRPLEQLVAVERLTHCTNQSIKLDIVTLTTIVESVDDADKQSLNTAFCKTRCSYLLRIDPWLQHSFRRLIADNRGHI